MPNGLSGGPGGVRQCRGAEGVMGSDGGGRVSDSGRQWAVLEEVSGPDPVSSNEDDIRPVIFQHAQMIPL